MKRRILPGFAGILWMCLIPWLCTVALNGAETALIYRRFDVEMFLPTVVASQISGKYNIETIKAQAVLARSDFYRRNSSEEIYKLLQEVREKLKPTYYLLHLPFWAFEEAVTATEGKVLTWQGELKLLPYHEISGGYTRDGKDTLKSEEYSYLKSIESPGDKEAEEFLNSVYVKERQLPEKLEIGRRDGTGYVTELLADGKRLEGETFRQGLGLTSANFTMQKVGDEVRFLCKGKGHGLGFSQYGGNVLAEEGSSYGEILEVYFPGMKLENVKSVLLRK